MNTLRLQKEHYVGPGRRRKKNVKELAEWSKIIMKTIEAQQKALLAKGVRP